MENYLIAMAVTAGIYALMALGLNVIWGLAGMVNETADRVISPDPGWTWIVPTTGVDA